MNVLHPDGEPQKHTHTRDISIEYISPPTRSTNHSAKRSLAKAVSPHPFHSLPIQNQTRNVFMLEHLFSDRRAPHATPTTNRTSDGCARKRCHNFHYTGQRTTQTTYVLPFVHANHRGFFRRQTPPPSDNIRHMSFTCVFTPQR
ncbi:unnamed protein product, partial [Ectocarpus sp. 12 AP-2014]